MFGASLEANITMNYEDVNIGSDVDRKFVSRQGDGNLKYQATNSMTVEMFNRIKANPDVRFTIEGELTRRIKRRKRGVFNPRGDF